MQPRAIAISLIVLAAGVAAAWFWRQQQQHVLPPGIAAANGRIEAVEIDVAARTPGRLRELVVEEGDFINAGQVLGHLDTAVLEAQQREAAAELQRSRIGIDTGRSELAQREAEKRAAEALVAQRQAELRAAQKRAARSEELAPRGAVSASTRDDHVASREAARAAVGAAEAQVAAAAAAIARARANLVAVEAAVEGAQAKLQRIDAEIDDSTLRSPREGRVQYRVAEPGEVVAAGGTVLNVVDLTDVYMSFFLPTSAAGRIALGGEARLVLDAAPHYVIPATVSFVSDVAQFTPKTVETLEERLKLMFRIKARIDPALLRRHLQQVKTGLPGVAYVKIDPAAAWPPHLQVRLPE